MKFNYTNSNNEESYYETVPLTQELYTNILEEDREFLLNVSKNKDDRFPSKETQEAATEMLQNYGKGKDGVFSSSKNDNVLILLALTKKVLKEGEKQKTKIQTTKAELRSYLASSKIRMFKKDKMSIVLDNK
jgi:hypothetical protein